MIAQHSDRLTMSFPSEREIVITRTFDAPRRLVFAAMRQPEHVRHWYGPSSLSMKSCEIDLRVGGTWRYVVQAPDGSEFAFSGVYQEISPPERIVSTELFEGMPGTDYLATLSLNEQDGRTTLVNHLLYQSQEHRDGHLHSGMEGGMRESFERLDEVVDALDRAEREIVLSRVFDAPPELVFKVWTEPEHVDLALRAAGKLGNKIKKLALYEPPFIIDNSRPPIPSDYVPHLRQLIAEGRPEDALIYFMTVAVGVPAEYVGGMKQAPFWVSSVKVAHTISYDGEIMGDTMWSNPASLDPFATIPTPTLVMVGSNSPEYQQNAVTNLAIVLPHAQYRSMAGQDHGIAPEVLGPALAEFFLGE